MACLARIFARLEQIFLLWQAGELPVHTSAHTQAAASRPDSALLPRHPARATPRHKHRRAATGTGVVAPIPPPVSPRRHQTIPRHRPGPTIGLHPPAIIPARLRPYPVRAPPFFSKSDLAIPLNHAFNVAIS